MAGYTERVDTLMTVLNDCAKNKYKRKIASEAIANSKTGTNVDKNDSSRNKSEPSNKAAKRKASVCLEFDSNGAPLIQGLVTESLDDSILLENVSYALGCIFNLFCRFEVMINCFFTYRTNLPLDVSGTNSNTKLRHCGSIIIIESN